MVLYETILESKSNNDILNESIPKTSRGLFAILPLVMVSLSPNSIEDVEATKAHQETKMLIWAGFAGSKGAANRIKSINLLTKNPLNINRLSEELHLDYKTIQHHVRVLETNNFVSKNDLAYPIIYFIAPLLESSMDIFEEIQLKTFQN